MNNNNILSWKKISLDNLTNSIIILIKNIVFYSILSTAERSSWLVACVDPCISCVESLNR